jgi:xanthosine utilization system XapX-like protein
MTIVSLDPIQLLVGEVHVGNVRRRIALQVGKKPILFLFLLLSILVGNQIFAVAVCVLQDRTENAAILLSVLVSVD